MEAKETTMADAHDMGGEGGEESPGWDGVQELHPAVLRSRAEGGEPLVLVDVREPWEWELVRLEGATHMPLGSFAEASCALDPDSEIVVICHHGARSMAAATFLAARGYRRVWNLSGGLDRYAVEGDPTMGRY